MNSNYFQLYAESLDAPSKLGENERVVFQSHLGPSASFGAKLDNDPNTSGEDA